MTTQTAPSNVSILSYNGHTPKISSHVFLADGVRLIGDLEIGAYSSIWFNTVIRADVNKVRIGSETNIQDGSVVHVTEKTGPCHIGDQVTIGHKATIHACTISDLCLIGMGAVVLDGAVIGKFSLVAAGSVVPPGKIYPEASLIRGSPARTIRPLTEQELAHLERSAKGYWETAQNYLAHKNV